MDPYIWMHGNLVADPTQTVAASGHKFTRFRIAASGRRRDATGQWVDTHTCFMSVVCWRQLGDNVTQSLRKGMTVAVHGRLLFSEYDDANGIKRQSYEIDANCVAPDLGRYVATLARPLRDLPAVTDPADVPAQPDAAQADPWTGDVSAAAVSAESVA